MTAAEFYDARENEAFVGKAECIKLMADFVAHVKEEEAIAAEKLKGESLNNGLKEQ